MGKGDIFACLRGFCCACAGVELDDELPENDHQDVFRPGDKLHLPFKHVENLNTQQYLESVLQKVVDNINRCVQPCVLCLPWALGSQAGQYFYSLWHLTGLFCFHLGNVEWYCSVRWQEAWQVLAFAK